MTVDSNGPAADPAAALRIENGSFAADDAEHMLDRNGKNFEEQLKALSGEEQADSAQAKLFNENGFFDSTPVEKRGGDSVPAKDKGENIAAARKAGEGETAEQVRAQLAAPAEKTGDEAVRTDFPEITGDKTARRGGGSSQNSPSPTAQKVSIIRGRPASLQPHQNFPSDAGSIQRGTDKMPVNPEKNDADETGRAQRQLQKWVQLSDLIYQSDFRRNRHSVRLALREIETGLQLIAEFKGLRREDHGKVKAQILALLAQHGLGNYDLLLNGDSFSNKIKRQEEGI